MEEISLKCARASPRLKNAHIDVGGFKVVCKVGEGCMRGIFRLFIFGKGSRVCMKGKGVQLDGSAGRGTRKALGSLIKKKWSTFCAGRE